MLIDTRTMGFALTDAIQRYVEARVESTLGPFARRVMKVTVRLEDVNANRGGIDKRCSIVVALRRQHVSVAEATDANLYAAVDEATSRIRRSVVRATKRRLARQGHPAARGACDAVIVSGSPMSKHNENTTLHAGDVLLFRA